MKDKIKLIDWYEKHLGLITATASLIGLIMTGIFKCISYWREKGYYDYWQIPMKYMEINYFSFLMQFLLDSSFTIVFILFGALYIQTYNSYKPIGRAILHIVPLFINMILIIYAVYRVGGTIKNIMNFSIEDILAICFTEMVLYIIEIALIHIFKEKKLKMNKNQINDNINAETHKSNMDSGKKSNELNESVKIMENNTKLSLMRKDNIKYLLVVISTIIIMMNIICFDFYNDKKENCEKIDKFEVINNNGQDFVILTSYKDWLFIRPCKINIKQHCITINMDKYMLVGQGNQEVLVCKFSDYQSVIKKVGNSDFIE